MTKQGRYQTPASVRTALEQRQRTRAAEQGVAFNRLAQIDLYFRFLDRLVQEFRDGALVVKGGLALEMRLQRARTTADIDLRAVGSPDHVYARIRAAGRTDLGDFLTFIVEDHAEHPDIANDGVVYEGHRFAVQAMFANVKYRERFGLDIVFGDPLVGSPEAVTAPDALSFMGIAPPVISLYPLGTHLAEKLHAYTLPRDHPNSRMKDLIDIALIACEPALKPSPTIDASSVREAIQRTFTVRATHPVPPVMPPPPPQWSARYPREKSLSALPWRDIDEAYAEALRFLDPVLQGTAMGTWDPLTRTWKR
jgi:hypothetical protein